MFTARSAGADSASAYGALVGPTSSGTLRSQVDWERQMENADKQQAQLFHMQWSLVKDQMAGFQREMGIMRSEFNVLQSNNQKGESGMREMRDGVDGMVQSIEAQVTQNLKQHRMQFEQTLQEQCSFLTNHINSLERELKEQQRILHSSFDNEKNERDRMNDHFTARHNEHTSQWQALQDEMGQALGGVHDRLSKHDEHRNGLQAALAQVDGDMRGELGRMQNQHAADHAALRDTTNSQKIALDSHFSSVRGMIDDTKGHHAGNLRDLEDKIRKEMLRAQDDQTNGTRGTFEAHKKALEDLERKVGGEQRALAEENQRAQNSIQAALTGHKDAHKEMLQNNLGNLDAELRKELARMVAQQNEKSDALHGKVGEQQSAVQKFMDDHQRSVDQQKSDAQRAADDLQRNLKKGEGANASQADTLRELRTLIGEHRAETDKKFDSESRARENLKDAHADALQSLDVGLKKELGRMSGDQDTKYNALQEAHNGNKATIEKHVGSMRGDHDGLRDQVFASVKDVERALRRDLGQLSEDHSSLNSKLQEQLEKAKGEHKSMSQAQIEEVDGNLRRELQRVQGDHKTAHSKLHDLHEDNKAAQEKAVAFERAAREDHKNGLQGLLSELEKQMQKEMKRLGDDHQSGVANLRDAINDHKSGIDKQLVGNKGALDENRASLLVELADHRSGIERQLASHKGVLDMHRSGLQEAIDGVDRELRKELDRQGDGNAGHLGRLQKQIEDAKHEQKGHTKSALEQQEAEMRAVIQRAADETGGKYSAFQRMLESIEAQLRAELTGCKGENQSTLQRQADEHNQKILALNQKHAGSQVHFQDSLSEHKLQFEKSMGGHVDNLREMVQTEKTERYRHHASLQERFDVIETALVKEDAELRDRLRTQLEQPSSITRGEFDGEVQRLWQAIDTHTHVDEAKPHVTEERIIMKQEPLRPVSTIMTTPQPIMTTPQPRMVIPVREEIIMGAQMACQSMQPRRTQSIGIAAAMPAVMQAGSFIHSPRNAQIQEIDIITRR